MTTPTGSPVLVVHMKTHSFCLANNSCSRELSSANPLMSTENCWFSLMLMTRLDVVLRIAHATPVFASTVPSGGSFVNRSTAAIGPAWMNAFVGNLFHLFIGADSNRFRGYLIHAATRFARMWVGPIDRLNALTVVARLMVVFRAIPRVLCEYWTHASRLRL